MSVKRHGKWPDGKCRVHGNPQKTPIPPAALKSPAQKRRDSRTFAHAVHSNNLDAGRRLAETERSPLPWDQRLGYLLERVEAANLAAPLAEHVAAHTKEYVPLRPRKSVVRPTRDSRWRLFVNEAVEADL